MGGRRWLKDIALCDDTADLLGWKSLACQREHCVCVSGRAQHNRM